MKPHELIEAQKDLVERASGNTDFQLFLAGILHSQNTDLGKTKAKVDARQGPIPRQLGNHLATMVRNADLYQVTEDMTPLIMHAATGLDELDRWSRHNAPSPLGLVRFERPLAIVDVRGRTMLCHWVAWGPTTADKGVSGLGMFVFNDIHTEPDEIQHHNWAHFEEQGGRKEVERVKRMQGRWACMAIDLLFEDQRLGPPTTHPNPAYQAQIVADGHTPTEATNLTRLMHALFLLLNQTIVHTAEPEIPRSHLKIARRMKMPGKITVITLRRFDGSRYEGESMVEWSHRWVVKGHWAWRKCSEHHPLAQSYEKGWRARLWIAPYIKGPDGKPLVITDKIYKLAR